MKTNTIVLMSGVVLACLCSVGCQFGAPAAGDGVAIDTARPQTTITAECVVTFYSPGEADYFSEQTHAIRPVSANISITAREPSGACRWELTNGVYRSSGHMATVPSSPAAVIDADILRAIVTAFRAAAGYIDPASGTRSDKIMVNGRWYEPIELPDAADTASTIMLLESAGQHTIDLIGVRNNETNAITAARAYNMRMLDHSDRSVATKIDVIRQKADSNDAVRILQVHYRRLDVR